MMKNLKILMLMLVATTMTSCSTMSPLANVPKDEDIKTYIRNIEREFNSNLVYIQTKYEYQKDRYAWIKITEETMGIHKEGDGLTIRYQNSNFRDDSYFKFVDWGW